MSIEKRTLATYGIMGILVSYYGIMVMSGVDPVAPNRDVLLDWGAYFPPKSEFSRIPSSIFVFGHALNLAFALLGMFYIARQVEVALGSVRMLLIFFLSGLLGGLASAYFTPAMVHAGAMPCVFGLLGAYWGFFFYNRNAYPPEHFRSNLGRFFLTLLMFIVIDYTSNNAGMYEDYIVFGAGMIMPWLFGVQVDASKSLRVRDALAVVVVLVLIGAGGHYTRDFLSVSPAALQARKGDSFNAYLTQVRPIFLLADEYDKEFQAFSKLSIQSDEAVLKFFTDMQIKWEPIRAKISKVNTPDEELAAIQKSLVEYSEKEAQAVSAYKEAGEKNSLDAAKKFKALRNEAVTKFNEFTSGLKAFRTKYKF